MTIVWLMLLLYGLLDVLPALKTLPHRVHDGAEECEVLRALVVLNLRAGGVAAEG